MLFIMIIFFFVKNFIYTGNLVENFHTYSKSSFLWVANIEAASRVANYAFIKDGKPTQLSRYGL